MAHRRFVILENYKIHHYKYNQRNLVKLSSCNMCVLHVRCINSLTCVLIDATRLDW